MSQDPAAHWRTDTSFVTLSQLETGVPARVLGLQLDPREGEWLRAVGIAEGQRVTVIRRALFGGPVHVRIESGGEYAIDRTLAGAIHCARDEAA